MLGSTDTAVVELVLTVGDKEYRQKLGEDGNLLKKFGSDAKTAGDGATSFIGRLTAMRGAVASLGGALAAAKIGSFVYDTAKSFESLNAQLITSEKTQARAQIAFERIREFAANTPYELEQVTQAYIKLRNLGLDPSTKALTAYGNIAGGLSKSLDQVIEAVADASTFQFERLRDFGISARQQGDQVKFTFAGVTTTVAKNAEEITRYLQSIGEVNFAGGMERQAKTLEGVSSNLGDSFAALASKVDSKAGFTGAIKSAMQLLTQFTNQLAGVPRSIADIDDQIAALTSKMASVKSGDRDGIAEKLLALQKERLDALLGSSDLGRLKDGIQELQTRIDLERAAIADPEKSNFFGGGSKKVLSDLEFRLALANGRKKNLDSAAAAESEERRRAKADQDAARAADERERSAKVFAQLRKAEEQMLFNEAKYQQDIADGENKSLDALREKLKLRAQAASDINLRTSRTLDLQGYSPEDQQRIGQLQSAADKYDTDQQALDDYYAGQLERQAEYQDASKALLRAYQEEEKAINQARGEDAIAIDAAVKQVLLLQAVGFGSDAVAVLQQFAGDSKGLQLGLLAFQKALAIAEIIISTQVAAAKAGEQLGIFGLPAAAVIEGLGYARVALVAATGVAEAAQIKQGGGRQFGGPAGAASLHPFMEGGDPEVVETANGKVFLGVPGGGRVSPAQPAHSAAPSGGTWNVRVVNPPGVANEVERSYVDRDELVLVMRQTVQAAVGQVQRQAASPSSPINKSLQQSLAVRPRGRV